jgi:hypothetical protein
MYIYIHREEENGGFNPSGGGAKETDAPEEHEVESYKYI